MNNRLLAIVLIGLLYSLNIMSQNLLTNGDFEANGGSLAPWVTTVNTELGTDGSDHYARLFSENGVLYQKVPGIVPGKVYTCSVKFKSTVVKQTTGYGFAIEKGTPLSIPTFTTGASNLKPFCENNSGIWNTLTTDVSEQNVTKTFNVLMPDNATAIYICVGTKGAVSELKVSEVIFEAQHAVDLNLSIKSTATGLPVQGAEISIDGSIQTAISDNTGSAILKLVSQATPYTITVVKDWYKKQTRQITVSSAGQNEIILLDTIQEIKKVTTRISKYGDNATPYPLYGHMWNSGLSYSAANISTLTNALDYIIGGSGVDNSKTTSNNLHAANSAFQVIIYQGGWTAKSALMEADKLNNMLYYRCGTLSASIGANDSVFTITKPSDNKGLGLLASETGNFTTWVRINNELMKIITVSSTTTYPITVKVQRGMDGTTPAAYASGSTITAPLYGIAPIPGGNNSNLSYFSPVWGLRKGTMLNNMISFAENGNSDGIWIDILVGQLDAESMLAGNYTLWNHAKNSTLSSDDIIKFSKDAMSYLYNTFYARMGYFPVIYGNNVLYSNSLTSADRGYMMVKTTQHPKVLDGFCHENSWGHMTDAAGTVDNDGVPVTTADVYKTVGNNGHFLEWYMGTSWESNCKAIALLAQNNLPNQPMTINAGYKNQWFAADLTTETRYNFNKYCYASYLMCVNVAADSSISCRMGISPMVQNGSSVSIMVEPFFYYPIGIPKVSKSYAAFTQYRVGSQNLYARQFSNGIVLVNPFQTDMSVSVPLSQIAGIDTIYVDPENNNAPVTEIKLASRESKILLFGTSSVAVGKQMANNFDNIELFPVPARNILNLRIGSTKNQKTPYEIVDKTGRIVQSHVLNTANGSAKINIDQLSTGVYFIKFGGLNRVMKFVKQ